MSDPQGKGLVLFSRESDVSQDVVVFIDLYSHEKKTRRAVFFPPSVTPLSTIL